MVRSLCFCMALVSAGVAYGQQTSVQVQGGRIIGTFVPDGQISLIPDPMFQAPQQQSHAGNCWCQVCQRRILSQQTRERSKTIREITTVTVVEETHPSRIINNPQSVANPYSPQNPYAQPRNSGVLPPWNQGVLTYAQWRQQQCAPRQRRTFFGMPIVSVNAGVSVVGFGPQINASVGRVPPYAQSGHNYGGNYEWYGGR